MQFQQPYPPMPPMPPQRPKRNAGKVIALVVAGFFGLLLFGSCVAVLATSSETPASSSAKATRKTSSAAPSPTPSATSYTPQPTDFKLRVKILQKQCFGTAGCNVTYRIELGYLGPTLDPDVTYDVTYEVRGVEDGPAVNTLTLVGDQYQTDSEETASTTSAGVKLRARVTEVTEQ